MVSAALEAAERQPSAGADRGRVPVHHSAVERGQAALEGLAARGVDAGRQSIVGGVGDGYRLLLRAGVVDGQVGAEQLLALVSRARPRAHAVHARRDVPAPQTSGGKCPRLEHRLGRCPAGGEELLPPGFRRERSHEHPFAQGVSDGKPLRCRGDARGHRVGARRRTFDDQAARGGAALARGHERREESVVHGLVQVRVAQHQRGVLPAHFQREQLGLAQRGALDGLADRPAAGEEHSIHPRMRGERGADGTGPLHQVECARRHAGFRQTACVHLGGVRRDLARLEDDRVSAGERRQHVAVGEVDGKVEGPEHRDDAQRAEPTLCVGLARRGERRHEPQPVFHRDRRLGHAGLHLGTRLPQRLADVQRDGARQLLRAPLQHLSDAAHQGGPLAARPGGPRRLRRARRVHSAIDLGERPAVATEEHAKVRRTAVLDDPLGALGLGERSGDEVHGRRITLPRPRSPRGKVHGRAARYR